MVTCFDRSIYVFAFRMILVSVLLCVGAATVQGDNDCTYLEINEVHGEEFHDWSGPEVSRECPAPLDGVLTACREFALVKSAGKRDCSHAVDSGDEPTCCVEVDVPFQVHPSVCIVESVPHQVGNEIVWVPMPKCSYDGQAFELHPTLTFKRGETWSCYEGGPEGCGFKPE